jgi:hypothetical protein
MPAIDTRPTPTLGVEPPGIFSAPDLSSKGSATTGEPSVIATSEASTTELKHSEVLRYVLDTTRYLTISTSETGTPVLTPSAQPSAASMNLDQGGHRSLGPSELSFLAETDPSVAPSGGSAGGSSAVDEQEDNALEDPPVDPKILASAADTLRRALQSQDPRKRVNALLDENLLSADSGSRFGGLKGLSDSEWQDIIHDVCGSAKEACEDLGNPTLNATLAKLVALERQRVNRIAKREETGGGDKGLSPW